MLPYYYVRLWALEVSYLWKRRKIGNYHSIPKSRGSQFRGDSRNDDDYYDIGEDLSFITQKKGPHLQGMT